VPLSFAQYLARHSSNFLRISSHYFTLCPDIPRLVLQVSPANTSASHSFLFYFFLFSSISAHSDGGPCPLQRLFCLQTVSQTYPITGPPSCSTNLFDLNHISCLNISANLATAVLQSHAAWDFSMECTCK
jgi:hypothetical protein